MKDLQQAGVYAKTDCINALDTSVGDTEKAILALEKMAMRPILQRVLNSCLPDNATQDEVIMALTRQTNTQTPQDRANFEAIVKDLGQNMDVCIMTVLSVIILPDDKSHSYPQVPISVHVAGMCHIAFCVCQGSNCHFWQIFIH